jgi:hypothetical protein
MLKLKAERSTSDGHGLANALHLLRSRSIFLRDAPGDVLAFRRHVRIELDSLK